MLWVGCLLLGVKDAQGASGGGKIRPAVAQQEPPPVAVQIIVAPPPVLPVDQPLEVAVEVTGTEAPLLGAFPNLPGFKKTSRDRRTTTRTIGAATVTTVRITQRYLAFGEGEKALPAFSISVNGQAVLFAGTVVRIGPATSVAPTGTPPPDAGGVGYGLAEDVFGKPRAVDYRDVPDHARFYLTLTSDQPVWTGEGVRARLYLTIAPEDQAILNFAPDFGRQIEELRRAIKPLDVWEETPATYPLVPDTVVGADEALRLRFLLHDAVYYPLTAARPLRFPAVELRLIKYRLAKTPVEGATNRLATDYVVRTQPLQLAVRPLPPHPLAGAVPVGELKWRDYLSRDRVPVNQPTRYWVEIEGTGNLAPIRLPEPLTPGPGGLAAYRPRVTTTAAWPPVGPGAVGGRKRFEWELLATQAGTYRFDSLAWLVYFDPRRGRYDTLRSSLRWRVVAGARRVATPGKAPWDDDPFYARLDHEPLDFVQAPDPATLRLMANVVLALLAAVGAGLWWTGRQQS